MSLPASTTLCLSVYILWQKYTVNRIKERFESDFTKDQMVLISSPICTFQTHSGEKSNKCNQCDFCKRPKWFWSARQMLLRWCHQAFVGGWSVLKSQLWKVRPIYGYFHICKSISDIWMFLYLKKYHLQYMDISIYEKVSSPIYGYFHIWKSIISDICIFPYMEKYLRYMDISMYEKVYPIYGYFHIWKSISDKWIFPYMETYLRHMDI